MLDNINPMVWGNPFWRIGYLVTYAYPVSPTFDDRQLIVDFFNQYQKILPCEKCRINFQNHLKKYPLTNVALSNKFNLMTWFLNINNEVNKVTNKPLMTLNDVYEKYLIAGNTNTFQTKQIITASLVFLLVIVLVVYLIIKNKQKI